jgi:hypothetical protein
VLVGAEPLTGEALKALLKKGLVYQSRLEKLAAKKDARVIDALIQAAHFTPEMLADRAAAQAELDRSIAAAPDSPTTWEIVALLQRHWREDPSRALAIGDVVRNQPLASGPSELAYATFDIATFRGYPADGLVPSAHRMLPGVPWPWILEPLLAAD